MSETIYHRYRLKRRTTAGWAANNEVLLAGEPGIEVLVDGTEKIKYGDGVKTWAQLSYAAGAGGVGPAGPTGPAGPAGAAGAAATVGVGTVTTGAAGSAAAVTNAGTSSVAVLNFTIPRGDTGATGPQGPAGAASTVPGPQGPAGATGATGPAGSTGAAATIAVGTVTTGAAGSAAAINNAGTNSAAVFDFTIPRGDAGATGPQGPAGATGPAGVAGPTGPQGPAGPVAGTNGQVIYNNAGAPGGLSTLTADGSGNLTFTGRWIQSTNAAASAPPMALTGTWFTGGTSTTTKPQFLIEPAGTTSTSWNTAGTGLGVNAPSGFTGNLLDLQVNGGRIFRVDSSGVCNISGTTTLPALVVNSNGGYIQFRNFSGSQLIADTNNDVSQRNGTAAQTGRIYNTFTSATNFERLNIRWTSNEAIIDTEAGSGGGTLRGLRIGSAATSLLGFYTATPVAQPAAVADATDAASVITQLNLALARLRTLGLIAT